MAPGRRAFANAAQKEFGLTLVNILAPPVGRRGVEGDQPIRLSVYEKHLLAVQQQSAPLPIAT